MMLSDVCLSDVCHVHPVGVWRVRPAGWMARIGWLGPAWPAWLKAAAAGLLLLQVSAGAYHGGRPPTACSVWHSLHFTLAKNASLSLFWPCSLSVTLVCGKLVCFTAPFCYKLLIQYSFCSIYFWWDATCPRWMS